MLKPRSALALVLVASITFAAGMVAYVRLGVESPTLPTAQLLGQQRPIFTLPGLDGNPSDIRTWDKNVVLINFWATWCVPCRREIPLLVEAQDRYHAKGLQVIGIAIGERADVSRFAQQMQINYPLMVAEMPAIRVARQYGNTSGALPYSVLVDRQQQIIFTYAGELNSRLLEERLLPALK